LHPLAAAAVSGLANDHTITAGNSTTEEVSMASPSPPAGGNSADAAAGGLSEETKRKVAAAKSYIENMYKVQHQNIQERYAR
jgi:hypothetical protein